MLPVLAVLAAAVLFGTTGTSQALGPEGTTPWAVGAVRLAVGGTALAALGFALARRHRTRTAARTPPLTRRAFALMALTGICLAAYQPLFFLGTTRSGVAVGTVVALGAAPVLAGLIEWALTRRLPRRTWMIATALATLGVVLLAFGGGADGGVDPVGVLGSLGAGAAFAVFANAQRRLMDGGWDPFTVAGAMGLGSAICAVAMLPFADLTWLTEPSGIALALWLGLATIAIAYTLFTWGLQRLTAATAATLTLAEPVTAALLGVLVLGEVIPGAGLAGVAALAAGLVLLAWGSRGPKDPRPFAVEA
ncbi:EamA family transporter [Microbacterium sp. NPDC089189]|uniref:DMT family transporter n=1 Tax=Microbacterium sp. NPDC089189 TaxID=3154972 RepID=UPI0034256042